MNRAVLYHVSMGLIGISIGLVGVQKFSTRGTIGAALMILGGAGVFATSGYAFLETDTSDFDPGRLVWGAVLAAVLALLGAVLQFFPLIVS